MEIVVKEFEKNGEIEKIEVHNLTLGLVAKFTYKATIYDLLRDWSMGSPMTITYEKYVFDTIMLNKYVKLY